MTEAQLLNSLALRLKDQSPSMAVAIFAACYLRPSWVKNSKQIIGSISRLTDLNLLG